jgi:hypothetical protein
MRLYLSQNFTGNGNGAHSRIFILVILAEPVQRLFGELSMYNTRNNINLIIDKGIKDENWDYVGVAYAMRAWGFQQLTDYFSDAPFYQAWQPNRATHLITTPGSYI